MKFANFIPALMLGLLAAPALAQEPNGSGKGNPNGMSYQDYLIQREKILNRMRATSPPQGQQAPEHEGGRAKGEAAHASTYGQGYGSRKDAKDAAPGKPGIESRPERPERPHIERPGRP